MDTAQRLLKHFGTVKAVTQAFDISAEAFRLWRRDGIPLKRAHEVETLTGGKIKATQVLSERHA